MNPRKLYPGNLTECDEGHSLTGADGLNVGDDTYLCRKCRAIGNRSYGSEWRNARGQVFVFLPDHPYSKKDGFYARAKVVMEEKIDRILSPEERVYHVDEDPSNDDPDNLMLFESQHALAQHRSKLYQDRKKKLGGGWAALTPAQREYQEARAREKELEAENARREEARQRSLDALKRANEKRRKK